MQLNFKDDVKNNKMTLLLSFLCAAVSLFVVFFNDVLLPVSTSLLAVIFLLEVGKKKIFSIILPFYILILNVLSIVFVGGYLFSGIETVLMSLILSVCFSKNVSKSDTAFILTLLASSFVLLNGSFLAMTFKSDYTFDSVKAFYSEFYEVVRSELVKSVDLVNSSMPSGSSQIVITSEDVNQLLYSVVCILPSFIGCVAFIVSGVLLKLFSFTASRICKENNDIAAWRFKPSSVFAYFYIALVIVSIFTGVSDSIVAISVANLSNIFCLVFAYVGVKFAHSFLSGKRKPFASFAILAVGLVVFSSLMIEILSFVGAFVTVSDNRINADK